MNYPELDLSTIVNCILYCIVVQAYEDPDPWSSCNLPFILPDNRTAEVVYNTFITRTQDNWSESV